MNTKVMFSSLTPHWKTPPGLYQELDREFHFNDDPCPLECTKHDGLSRDWGTRTFLNPPYGREIGKWVEKAHKQAQNGCTVVCLVPSRTDTRWWHDYVMKTSEIRFIKGRLKFGDAIHGAPFPSAIVVFRPETG